MSTKKSIVCDICRFSRNFPLSMSVGKAYDLEFKPIGWKRVYEGKRVYDFCPGCIQAWDGTDALIREAKELEGL